MYKINMRKACETLLEIIEENFLDFPQMWAMLSRFISWEIFETIKNQFLWVAAREETIIKVAFLIEEPEIYNGWEILSLIYIGSIICFYR